MLGLVIAPHPAKVVQQIIGRKTNERAILPLVNKNIVRQANTASPIEECSMRSTRASNALARLKSRSGNDSYSMQIAPNGTFSLLQVDVNGQIQVLSAALELDDFVRLVDATGPQKPKKISKLDVAFEKQLVKK